MTKRIISLILSITLVFSVLCPAVHADGSADFGSCSHDWQTPIVHGYSITIPNSDISFGVEFQQCSKCHWYKHDASLFIVSATYYSPLAPDLNGIVPTELITYWCNKYYEVFGKNATAKPYQTGGGSAGTGGVGRHPSGYADDTGTPSVSPTGAYTVSAPLRLYPLSIDASSSKYAVDSPTKIDNYSFTSGNIAIVGTPSGIKVTNGGSSDANITFGGGYRVNVSAAGYLSVASGVKAYTGMGSYRYSSDDAKELWSIEHPYRSSNKGVFGFAASKDTTYFVKFGIKGDYNDKTTSDFTSCDVSVGFNTITKTGSSNKSYLYPHWSTLWIPHNSEAFLRYDSIPVSYVTNTTTINQTNNITINNNTWNGNIYQDNSTNLTYIYPQYTTINENNETVTNISNNPIIYNNETKQYYTYDTVTNNYYYITYEAPTPSPTPDPTPTPTPTPGGDTGDTNSLLNVLVQIRDNMIQGFADIKATLVQGWADLSANFTLAIENLNLNITNIFNKKFPDQSTPETAKPGPSPSPSPSPTPDPGETPTPTPAPTDKPSGGNTNNFWNFVFPGGSDDGTENGHKGILWALISLLIAVVTFVLGLGSAYSYVFPFLPAGLVTTIHICVLVLLLFAIIKFVRSFL